MQARNREITEHNLVEIGCENIRTISIKTLTHLAEFLDSFGSDRPVFRGQPQSSWGLVPTMFRGMESVDWTDSQEIINDRERDIFREFSDRSVRFRSGSSPWDVLVLAQHYGTPTRLLDWTSNAQAALYFAAASAPSSDGAVWCIVPSRLPMPPRFGRIHDGLGYRRERLAAYVPEWDLPFCEAFSKTVLLPSLHPDSPVSPEPVFDQTGDPKLPGLLTFFLPEHTNERIHTQAGLFSVYISEHSAGEVVIDHAQYIRMVERRTSMTLLQKLVVPASAKTELLVNLERVGVDARSVYPDLHGLGLYLSGWQQQLVREIRHNPSATL